MLRKGCMARPLYTFTSTKKPEPRMEFNPELHQKVRYMGQLYVVMLDEFPHFQTASPTDEFVLHPISNDWIVHIISPTVRNLLKVKKKDFSLEEHAVMI